MIIINNQKFYSADIRRAEQFESASGWDRRGGGNYQFYALKWDEQSNLVILDAQSDDVYGDNRTRFFESPVAFSDWCRKNWKQWQSIFINDPDEERKVERFVDQILNSKKD